MILFFAAGRLGNQLFQYAFLRTIRREEEKVCVVGFDELMEVFDIKDVCHWLPLPKGNRYWHFIIYKVRNWLKNFFSFLAFTRLISSIRVNYEKIGEKYRRETLGYTFKKGLFSRIYFVYTGYFQSEKFFDKKVIEHLLIKDYYMNKAKEILSDIPVNSYKVFVHVRRGDYKDFLVLGKDCILPIVYYHNQIAWFLQNRENCFFIFLSDEPEYLEKEFSEIRNKKYVTIIIMEWILLL